MGYSEFTLPLTFHTPPLTNFFANYAQCNKNEETGQQVKQTCGAQHRTTIYTWVGLISQNSLDHHLGDSQQFENQPLQHQQFSSHRSSITNYMPQQLSQMLFFDVFPHLQRRSFQPAIALSSVFFYMGLIIGLSGVDGAVPLCMDMMLKMWLSMNIEEVIKHRVLCQLSKSSLWLSRLHLQDCVDVGSQACQLSLDGKQISSGGLVFQNSQLNNIEEFVDQLNLLLILFGHPLLYAVLFLNNGFQHPRLNVLEQSVHLRLQLVNLSYRDCGVDLEKLGACEEDAEVGIAGFGAAGSAPWASFTLSTMFLLMDVPQSQALCDVMLHQPHL